MKSILPSLWGATFPWRFLPKRAAVGCRRWARRAIAALALLATIAWPYIYGTAVRRVGGPALVLLAEIAANLGPEPLAEPNLLAAEESAGTDGGAAANGDAAGQVVRQAADRLERYRSISCRMRWRGEIYDQPVVGNGEYRQLALSSNRLRWDTKLQIGDSVFSVQEVADGKYLWINFRKPQQTILSRVELAKLAESSSPAHPPVRPPSPLNLTSVGGLPKLVRNLDHCFRFSRLSETRLNDAPVLTVRGDWTPKMLAMLVPDQQASIQAGRPVNWEKVPEQVPQYVVLALRAADYFPCRVEYRRTEGDRYRVLLAVELYDAKCNVPLEQALFTYQPGKAPVTDVTDQFIANLISQ